MDEIENGFCEVEPVVVGEAAVDLFEEAIFSDLKDEYSIVFFLNLNFFDDDILCQFLIFSFLEDFP